MKSIGLFLAGLCLAACTTSPSQSGTTRREENGKLLLLSHYRVDADGTARFDCQASASGRCYYALTPYACPAERHPDGADCAGAGAGAYHFSLPEHGAAELKWRQGGRQCVNSAPVTACAPG